MVKNSPTSAGDGDSIPGSKRSPGVANGDLCRYSCLENYMGRGAWGVTMGGGTGEGHKELDTTGELKNRQQSPKLKYLLQIPYPLWLAVST